MDLPEDVEEAAVVLGVLLGGLDDAALVQAGDLAVDVGVAGELADGGLPLRRGRLAVDVVAQDVVHDHAQFGDGAGQGVDLAEGFDALAVHEDVGGEPGLGEDA